MVKVKNPDEIAKLITSGPYEKKRIFSIVAHIDHGKTTASDYLLRRAGLMREEDAGQLQMTDSDDEEQARGITIFTSVVLLSFNDPRDSEDDEPYIFQINDTPGHISFTGEVSRALRGSDGAIILVDALEGVMTQTETNIRLAVGNELCKPVLFINKVDRLISELKLSPQETYDKIDKITKQVNNLIKKVRPEGFDWGVDFADNSVAVGSAKHGWGFTYEILKKNDYTPITVFEKYNEGDIQWLRKNLPLDEAMLRMVVDHLPNPVTAAEYRIPHIWSGDVDSEMGQALLKSDPKGPLTGMITKIFLDPKKNYAATLIGRVFSGTLDQSDNLFLVNSKTTSRIKRLGVMEITDLLDIPEIPAGNLFAMYGFICPSGESFISADNLPKDKEDQDKIPSFESISYACEAVVSRSIKPKDPHDLAKLGEVVGKWLQADPTAEFRLDKESKEYILSGIDPLQIDILTKRINNQVEIEIGEPIIVYREKINQKSRDFHTKSSNAHNRIQLYLEPLDERTEKLIERGKITDLMNNKERAAILREQAEWDAKEAKRVLDVYKGNLLVNGTSGLQRLDRVKSYLSAAFRDWVDSCILAKEPAMGIKVVFTDMTIHEDPAHTGYNQIASMTFAGLSLAMMDAKPHIYEPIQKIDIKTPQGTESGVLAVINKHRGRVNNVLPEGEYVRITGELPASETIGIADEIRGTTQGRAFFGYEFSGFEKVPAQIENDLILEIRKRKGMKVELPNVSSWERFLYKRS
ncbi:MAG: GTP-binding protein [Candidatus Lokiarchaeota archaeon]|nr:GTP-binding protein [Candidatus Lokiarchaeota archaeon]MBD3337689.1 GTP-binding protein [Candidatus Lokiarchaeota archaeon]